MLPAIVLSAHVTGLGVIRSLGMMGVPIIAIYTSKKDMGSVSKYVKEKYYAPHPEEHEDKFIGLLLNLAKRFKGSLLIPADDETLTTVSRHKLLLEGNYKLAFTESSVTQICINKENTYMLADKLGIPVPKTRVPQSFEDILEWRNRIEFPCVVKPVYSHRYFNVFKKKLVRVDNFEQLMFHYREAVDHGLEVLIQELIPGDDTCGINYCSYFCGDKFLAEFTAEKVRLAPTHFGVPRVLISKHIPEIISPTRKLLQAMKFCGYSCVEYKKDSRNGVYKLMDINGRMNRSILHSLRCGINFPWIVYNHQVYNKLPLQNSFVSGVYWIDLFSDIIHSVKCRGTEKYNLRHYIKPYINPCIFSIFCIKDFKPIIKRGLDVIRQEIQKISNRIRSNVKLLLKSVSFFS